MDAALQLPRDISVVVPVDSGERGIAGGVNHDQCSIALSGLPDLLATVNREFNG